MKATIKIILLLITMASCSQDTTIVYPTTCIAYMSVCEVNDTTYVFYMLNTDSIVKRLKHNSNNYEWIGDSVTILDYIDFMINNVPFEDLSSDSNHTLFRKLLLEKSIQNYYTHDEIQKHYDSIYGEWFDTSIDNNVEFTDTVEYLENVYTFVDILGDTTIGMIIRPTAGHVDRHHYTKIYTPHVVVKSTTFEIYSTLIIIIIFAAIAVIFGIFILKS